MCALDSTNPRLLLCLAALPLSLACGESDDSPNSPGGGGDEIACPDPNEGVNPALLIDDMEDQNELLVPVGGRSGGWWTAGDETSGATLEPPLGATVVPEPIPEGRCGSNYAMRLSGQGFEEWGAMLGLSLVYGEGGQLPYDASNRDGIKFWARIGDTSTNQMRFAIGDGNSEPEGGVCEVGGGTENGCYDTFGIVLTLTESWRLYTIPFEDLSQRDFGLKAEGLATEALYSLQFTFVQGSVFDLWIDDVEFF